MNFLEQKLALKMKLLINFSTIIPKRLITQYGGRNMGPW